MRLYKTINFFLFLLLNIIKAIMHRMYNYYRSRADIVYIDRIKKVVDNIL